MKFKDLFVPRYLHSDPEVRLDFVKNLNDPKFLLQISEKDADETVRKAAADRAAMLMAGQTQTAWTRRKTSLAISAGELP